MTAMDVHDEVVVAALHELRAARKERRLGDWHVIDALYRAYIAAILGGLGVTMLSGVVGDRRITGSELVDVRHHGPAVVGATVALVLAIGLRTGSRGGPVALEAAEVRYVLLAPVDRDVALRGPARRQLRFTAFAGMVTGATVGLLAYRRLPGHPGYWVVSGAAVGALTGAAMAGTAMVASGRRIGRPLATVLGGVLLAWSTADIATDSMTSPMSRLAQLAFWPMDVELVSLLSILLVAIIVVAGLRAVGGLSLEAAERRGRLVSHLRFAATFQDLRTVMLLRRQLAAEVPRSNPWIRLRPARRGPRAWRRDWRGILRWPIGRLLRLALLGIVAGLSTAAAWSGTTPMVLVAGGALYIAALDAIEGLAQEVDHPDRRDSFPEPEGALHLRHLAAPTVVLAVTGLLGIAAAAVASGRPALALSVGLPLLAPSAVMAVGSAAVSTLRQPPDPARMMMDSTGTMMLFHHALPPVLATIGPASTLLVSLQLDREPSIDPTAAALNVAVNVAVVAALVLGWVRHRKALAGYLGGAGLQDLGK
jgi:hypothetical protein